MGDVMHPFVIDLISGKSAHKGGTQIQTLVQQAENKPQRRVERDIIAVGGQHVGQPVRMTVVLHMASVGLGHNPFAGTVEKKPVGSILRDPEEQHAASISRPSPSAPAGR